MDNRVSDLATRLGIAPDAAQEVYQAGWGDGRNSGIQSIRSKAGDITLSQRMYQDAYSRGMSLSAYLETLDPSEGYNDGLDAFERQLRLAGIKTRSIPEMGLWADRVERFWHSDKPGSETLFPEFMARTWRRATFADAQRFYASSNPVSDVIEPSFIQRLTRQKQIAPAIPLSAIVAMTTPVDSGVYQAFYLTDDEDERTMRRVAEGAEVPAAILTGADHTIRLKKYGRRLRASYESIRRMTIDRFAMHMALLAVQAEQDKVETGIDVLLSGDGNTGTTPTNSNLTTLDTSAVAGTLTLKALLAWRMKWANPYACNVILAREAYALQVLMLNNGSANVPFMQIAGAFGIGGVTPINSGLGPNQLGWTDAVTDAYLLGIDSRFALEMVQEIGTTLTETDRIIRQQMEEIVMTETLGFAIIDANAVKTMNVGA